MGKKVWQGEVVVPWGSVHSRTSSGKLGSTTRLEGWRFKVGWPDGLAIFRLYLAPVIFPTLETNGVHGHGRNRDWEKANRASTKNLACHDMAY